MTGFNEWRNERRITAMTNHDSLKLTHPTVYIAGPMTGYDDFNREAFDEVATIFRAIDCKVISPVELDKAEGFDHAADPEVTPEQYREFLLRDLKAILENRCDAVIVLDGWEDSKGAALEVHLAREVGLPLFTPAGERVKAPTKYRPPSEENVAETAQSLVGGDRQDQYGHPIEDFTRTAGVINALYGTEFGPRDIPIIMMAVKLSRVIQSPSKRDSIVDLIGYGLTYEMVAEREGDPLA